MSCKDDASKDSASQDHTPEVQEQSDISEADSSADNQIAPPEMRCWLVAVQEEKVAEIMPAVEPVAIVTNGTTTKSDLEGSEEEEITREE